jgi:uncharacterized protein with von Willebrand factor type A (vWA) domain
VTSNVSASGHFLHNLVLFGRLLRGLGMDVNPGRMIDLVHALEHIEIGHKDDFYHAARSLLVHDRQDIPLFDEAFEMFWRKPMSDWHTAGFGTTYRKRRSQPQPSPPPLREPALDASESDSDEDSDSNRPPVVEVTMTYSSREVLREKDFAELSGEELNSVKQLIDRLALQLGDRRTRRRRPGKGDWVDYRRTMRRSFKYGGEILEWARREAKIKPRPLVILADISGSMERYTRLLLHFIYSLTRTRHQSVEAFVFGTRLTRITRQLDQSDVDQALHEVRQVVHDWSGGTRIGESLKTFNFLWGRRVLSRGAVVLLISDGWDRGDIDLLQREMARLQRSCQRLIWLNPLLGAPEYEPLTRGIQAALPYIDDFLPVHNLASLEDLAEHLSRLAARTRPSVRKQHAVI